MIPERLKSALAAAEQTIRAEFRSAGQVEVEPHRLSSEELDHTSVVSDEFHQHLLWLCVAGRQLVDEGRTDKAMRWLGFVQGCLFAVGISTIAELKEANRA